MDKELIYQLYVTERLSTRAIAKRYGLSRSPIQRILKKYDIPLRTLREAHSDEYTPFRYYQSAIRRGMKFHNSPHTDEVITLAGLKRQWEKQKGRCAYSNVQLKLYTLAKSRYKCSMKSDLRHASLDRIDTTRGYEEGNVHYICWPLNLAKNTMPHKQMKKFLKLICSSKEK